MASGLIQGLIQRLSVSSATLLLGAFLSGFLAHLLYSCRPQAVMERLIFEMCRP